MPRGGYPGGRAFAVHGVCRRHHRSGLRGSTDHPASWNHQRMSQTKPTEVIVGGGERRWLARLGPVSVTIALMSALATLLIFADYTPVRPTSQVVLALFALNAAISLFLMGLLFAEARRLIAARRAQAAGARIHFRMVALFSGIAAFPALLMAMVGSVTLDRVLESGLPAGRARLHLHDGRGRPHLPGGAVPRASPGGAAHRHRSRPRQPAADVEPAAVQGILRRSRPGAGLFLGGDDPPRRQRHRVRHCADVAHRPAGAQRL